MVGEMPDGGGGNDVRLPKEILKTEGHHEFKDARTDDAEECSKPKGTRGHTAPKSKNKHR